MEIEMIMGMMKEKTKMKMNTKVQNSIQSRLIHLPQYHIVIKEKTVKYC